MNERVSPEPAFASVAKLNEQTYSPMRSLGRVFRVRVDKHSPITAEVDSVRMRFPLSVSLDTCKNLEEDYNANKREFIRAFHELCAQAEIASYLSTVDWRLAHTFASFLQIGDVLITMNPDRRWWPIGVVSGPYECKQCKRAQSVLGHERPVRWVGELPRSLMRGAFFTSYGSRAISDVTEVPGQWVDSEALSAVEQTLGGKWTPPPWTTKVLADRYESPTEAKAKFRPGGRAGAAQRIEKGFGDRTWLLVDEACENALST